jgi:hypothetical protein
MSLTVSLPSSRQAVGSILPPDGGHAASAGCDGASGTRRSAAGVAAGVLAAGVLLDAGVAGGAGTAVADGPDVADGGGVKTGTVAVAAADVAGAVCVTGGPISGVTDSSCARPTLTVLGAIRLSMRTTAISRRTTCRCQVNTIMRTGAECCRCGRGKARNAACGTVRSAGRNVQKRRAGRLFARYTRRDHIWDTEDWHSRISRAPRGCPSIVEPHRHTRPSQLRRSGRRWRPGSPGSQPSWR